jgi:hypothetical protein
MRNLSWLVLAILTFCCHPGCCSAAEARWQSIGVRGGLTLIDTAHYAHQYEGFAVYQLPWEARSASGWGVSTQVGMTAGILNSGGEDGFIGSLGPAFGLSKTGVPLEVDAGVSLAILNRDTFGSRDYNGKAQFISHGGLTYRFCERFGLGYRYQHMSNAGMNGGTNPGLNLHMIGIYWFFPD